MRSALKLLVALTASLTLVATGAAAEDASSEELQQMRDLMLKMQDQIEAQQDQLDAQRDQLEEAGVVDENSAKSKLSSFLEKTEFSGWVAASYTINSRNNDNNGLPGMNNGRGTSLALYPFHPDSNTFSLDQVWFTMDKSPTEESRAGFHVDLVFGKTASVFTGTNGANNGGNAIDVYQGYVSYLAPIANGIQVDFGKMATLLGAEVAQTVDNFNISRGLLYGLQPINHTGVIVSSDVGAGFSLAAGAVNDVFTDSITDSNKNKAITGQVAWSNDQFYVGASAIWGTNSTVSNSEGQKAGVADLVMTWDPTDTLSLWANYDYAWQQGPWAGSAHGIAVAGRMQVMERTGISLRGEAVFEVGPPTNGATPCAVVGGAAQVASNGGCFNNGGFLQLGGHGEIYEITATIDHMLTDNLMIRAEGRYDWANAHNRTPDNVYNNGGTAPVGGQNPTRSDQGVFIVEAVYTF